MWIANSTRIYPMQILRPAQTHLSCAASRQWWARRETHPCSSQAGRAMCPAQQRKMLLFKTCPVSSLHYHYRFHNDCLCLWCWETPTTAPESCSSKTLWVSGNMETSLLSYLCVSSKLNNYCSVCVLGDCCQHNNRST